MLKLWHLPRCEHCLFGATWALWQRLFQPLSHPVYKRTVKNAVTQQGSAVIAPAALLVGALLCGGLGSLRPLIESSSVVLGLTAIMIFTSTYVMIWVVQMVGSIVKEHENGTYELLCLSPYGALNTHLAIGAACLHQSNALGWISLLRKIIAGLSLFILLMAVLVTASQVQSATLPQFWALLLEITLLVMMLYYDHIQTTVLGSLVGMLVPAYSRINRHAVLWGMGLFFILQVLTLLIALVLLHLFGALLSSVFSPTLIALVVFYVPREGFILVLWRGLARRLNAYTGRTSVTGAGQPL